MNTKPGIINLLPRQSVAIAQRRVSDHLRRIVKSTWSLLRVANHLGLAAHPISSIDQTLARTGLGLPDDVVLHAAVIIGWQTNAPKHSERRRRHPTTARLIRRHLPADGSYPDT
ncbi:MAG: hypothetical protein GX413_01005 [Acetobacter sp.]|nr:hypothetical protein [Acetobacter sp.]